MTTQIASKPVSPSANLWLIFAVVATIPYCASVLLYAVNVPVGDDYALLGFMNEFHALTETSDKISLLFSLHNEHRIVVVRVVSLLIEAIFGSLDFRVLLIIGNAALVFALLHLGRILDFRNDMFKWTLLFLLVLQPQTVKLMFYPMAVVQAYLALLFSMIYLRILLTKKHTVLALIFFLLATLSTGSGIFLTVVGVPLLMYQKRFRDCFAHLFFSALIAYFYFAGLSATQSPRIDALVSDGGQALSYFFRLLGNIVDPNRFGALFYYPTLVCGGLLMTYFVYRLATAPKPDASSSDDRYVNQTVCFLYLMMTILLIAVGRFEITQMGSMEDSIDGRYRIYGIIFAAIVLTSIVRGRQSHATANPFRKIIIMFTALAFNLFSQENHYDIMREYAHHRTFGMELFKSDQDSGFLTTWAIDSKTAVINLNRALANGVYKP